MTDKTELIQGPVPKWKLTPEDEAVIAEWLTGDDELYKAYGEAYQAGCFVKEFGGGLTAVGEMDTIAIAAFRLGKEVNEVIDGLSIGECVELSHPGRGETREEKVRDGIRQVLEARSKNKDPEALDLFGSFSESGYKVEAFMPRNSEQPRQWTVKVTKDGEEEPVRVETIPMLHEPIFGVDVDDKATLESRVEEIMQELGSGSV